MIQKITIYIVRELLCLKKRKNERIKFDWTYIKIWLLMLIRPYYITRWHRQSESVYRPGTHLLILQPALCRTVLICVFLSLNSFLQAQEVNKSLVPLMVGDKLPESFWKQEHRFLDQGKVVTATLEKFKGKVMLIDFWASWCSSCRTSIPFIDSLGSRFKSDLAIVPVVTIRNQDKIPQIEQALKDALGKGYANSIPTIVEDTYIDAILPYKYLSTSILIGRHGRISGFIHHDLLTAETIKQLIDHTYPPKKRHEKVK